MASSGTTIKFSPVNGNDTMMKNNTSVNINTKHQCITVMKEYDNKSLEELRIEDYAENRLDLTESLDDVTHVASRFFVALSGRSVLWHL